MRFGIALAVALVCSSAWATPKPKRLPKQPPPPPVSTAQQDEIKSLEKELGLLQGKQAHFAAAKVARKLFDAQRKLDGDDHLNTIRRKQTLAQLTHLAGDDVTAVKLYKELIATAERLHGVSSREVFYALSMLDGVYWSQQHYDDAELTVRRMLDIEKQLTGPDSKGYADQLGMLATVLEVHNQWGQAVRTMEEVLVLREKLATAPDDIQLISAMQTLASMYWMSNQRAKAIPLYNREIAALTKNITSVWTVAAMIGGIASTYHYTGRDDLAAPLRKRVTEMYLVEIARLEKDKPDDFQIQQMAGMLGFGYRQANDWPNAEKWLTRAIELDEKKNHYSAWHSTLADVKRAQGKPKEALALLELADAEMHKINPNIQAQYSSVIADVLIELKDFKRAEQVADDFRAWIGKQFGKHHPSYGASEQTVASIYMQAGDAAKAEPILADSLELAEEELRNVLKSGTEADHAIYFASHVFTLDTALNFELKYASKSPTAARLALTTLLRRKGRVLDAAAASLANIRKQLSADDKQLLDDLASARNQLAKLTVAGPQASGDDFAKDVAALEAQIQKLEVQVGKKSTAYRVVSQSIDLAAVQKMIPKDARLVEIVNYQPFGTGSYNPNPSAPMERHYAAFVVGATGDPTAIDLGPDAPIDAAVEAFRKAVADPQNQQVTPLGKALFDLTMGKIAPKLGGSTNVLMAPDGTLNVVPFSALVDGNGDFLVKTYTFTYLTSGRDLLRLAAKPKAQGGGVIFADPSFDGDVKGGKSRGSRSMDLASLAWPQLPGTGQEADAVGKAMAGFKVFRGAQATETNVKALHGPRILHLATHGFFLPDEPPPQAKAASATPAPDSYENPLLRSGLAFAGANKLQSGDDDGILTALEASGLDLEGTRLVVLSACETGVGKVTNGEGVYGLRRALVIAGAESLVMSLWQVDDEATRDLMAGYYGRLKQGRGKSSALRDIQLEMQKKPAYVHPYYWASFLPAGDNSPL